MESTTTTIVLGKRKVENALVLHLSSKKLFKCNECGKTYSKPSRLEEHRRSHTGQRPYVCTICNNSYLRKSHLQAHTRSHLSDSARPFVCPQPSCSKRFWTSQHLRVHTATHNGEKSFICSEPNCEQTFAKHHQLRTHICTFHSPPGTKPYSCDHPGCDKSFSTNQHLRTHVKTHDEKRYTCLIGACAPTNGSPVFFQTWTALQHHTRTAHPPTCRHPSCNGKTFSSQKGLRAHLKLHEMRDVEAQLSIDTGDELPRKKRRGGEIGRDWICEYDGCGKDFKSNKALKTHTSVTHLGHKDHICPHEDCHLAFGYKHLLQRHIFKNHTPTPAQSAQPLRSDSESDTQEQVDIDLITGLSYTLRAKQRLRNLKATSCLFPELSSVSHTLQPPEPDRPVTEKDVCDVVFTRAYDLRRHLSAFHHVDVEKEDIEKWMKGQREKMSLDL